MDNIDAKERPELWKHDPTPDEIRSECEKIRRGWSRNERGRRAAYWVEQQRIELPTLPAVDEPT